jgi:hypothetical protein
MLDSYIAQLQQAATRKALPQHRSAQPIKVPTRKPTARSDRC